MADPQHLEWLKEGVDAWNRRRAEAPFKADLAAINLTTAEHAAVALWDECDGRADLERANLRKANLWRRQAESDGPDPFAQSVAAVARGCAHIPFRRRTGRPKPCAHDHPRS